MLRRPSLLAVPVLLVGLSACGGTATLSSGDVANKAEDALEQQVGVRPTISCPEDVKAEVGATTRCTLTAPDDPAEYGVSIKVNEVDGTNATFDIQVDDQPSG